MSEFITRTITALAIFCICFFTFFYAPAYYFSLLLITALLIILVYEMPQLYNYKKWYMWPATLAYPIAPFIILITLNQYPHYRLAVSLSFAISFINDVAAYCTGKLIGKHLLCPTISPKKTVEGFIGGWLALYVFFAYFAGSKGMTTLFFASFVCAAIATAGDIFESWLKRKARIKDASSLLPGHGGILDRFDSIMAIIVLMSIALLLRVY